MFSLFFSEDSQGLIFQVFSRFFFLASQSIGRPFAFGGSDPPDNLSGGSDPRGGPVTFGGPSRMWKISGPSLLPAEFLIMLFIIFLSWAKTTIGPNGVGHEFISNCRIKLRMYLICVICPAMLMHGR